MNIQELEEIVVSFVKQMQEYLDPDKALFIGKFASNFCFAKNHYFEWKKDPQRVGRSRRKFSNFLIWEKGGSTQCLDSLDEKYDFDFVFSDEIRPFRSNASQRQELEINGSIHKVSPGWVDIFNKVKLLKNNGTLILFMDSTALITKEYQLLSDIGFYVNAIFGLPSVKRFPRFLNKEHSIFIISKENNSSLFVADLKEEVSYTPIINNFIEKEKGTSLYTGYTIHKEEFIDFNMVRYQEQFQELKSHYKDYEIMPISELSDDNEQDFNDHSVRSESHVYILNRKSPLTADLPITISEPYVDKEYSQYYFCISLNESVKGEYIAIFLQSQLGKSLYMMRLSLSGHNNYVLSNENLRKLHIFLPSLEIQEKIIRAHNKIVDLQNSINTFGNNLSLNPSRFISESVNKIDDMLDQVGKLNATDKTRQLVERGECVNIEFKQTFGLETDSNKPDYNKASPTLQARIFEQMSAFLNTYGGTLLIGVDDDQHVTGMEKELKTLYGKNHDKFKLAFNGLIETYLGKDFTHPDYVTYDFVPIDNHEVFQIKCKQSVVPCRFGKDERLIVQEDPRIRTLKGDDELRYISKHFPEYYASHL